MPSELPDPVTDLRPLMRLRQIAFELHDAALRQDLALVTQASALLAPTLERWQHAHADFPTGAEADALVRETCKLLQESEETIRAAMKRTSAQLKHIQRGKRHLAIVRARFPQLSGRALDTER